MKIHAVAIAALLAGSSFAAAQAQNSSLLRKAHEAYTLAQSLEAELKQKPETDRTRADYLKVINTFQRVYLITPQTQYADNSLMAIARLYEEMKSNQDAIKTLKFLIHEYPNSPFREVAEKDIARLNGVKVQKTVSVDNVRYWDGPNSVRIIIDVTGDVTFTQGDAKNPDRVFVDISPARLNSALIGKQWPVKSNLLQQIRVGQYDNSTVRIVLEIGNVSRVTSFTLRDPDRLVIDVLGKEILAQPSPVPAPLPAGPITAAPAVEPPKSVDPPSVPRVAEVASSSAPASSPVSAPTPAITPKKSADDGKPITPAKATNSGARSLVRSLGLKLSRVVIDAGHGGHDTGTVGQRGYTEKELVLDVAQRLKQLIETELGAEVVMTRTNDNFVPLDERTLIANQQQADLFISIHANSSRVRSVRGVETYFLNFTSSREALETASRENAASDRSIHELQDLVKKIMLQDKVDESRELAQHIDRALAARKGSGMDRGVKQAPFVVLIGANMPSVLAEICFISNPQDEKLVKTPEHRQAIAESLFEGVRSYAESLSGTKTAKTQEKTQE
jgi:N-acetylmuramoyl-L-alanine amidase